MNKEDALAKFKASIIDKIGVSKLTAEALEMAFNSGYDAGWAANQSVSGFWSDGNHDAFYEADITIADKVAHKRRYPSDEQIERIYSLYPRKVGKQAAIKAIRKACEAMGRNRGILLPVHMRMESAVAKYAEAVAQWPKEDQRFIPHPATWFNEGRYEDDPKEWVRESKTTNAISHISTV